MDTDESSPVVRFAGTATLKGGATVYGPEASVTDTLPLAAVTRPLALPCCSKSEKHVQLLREPALQLGLAAIDIAITATAKTYKGLCAIGRLLKYLSIGAALSGTHT